MKKRLKYFDKKTRIVGAGVFKGKVVLFYQIVRGTKKDLRLATSSDGLSFIEWKGKVAIWRKDGREERIDKCDNFYISTASENEYLLTYLKKLGTKSQLVVATSKDAFLWEVKANTSINETGIIVPLYKYQNHNVLYYGNNTLRIALSKDLEKWELLEGHLLTKRENWFDSLSLKIMGVMPTPHGLFVIYDSSYEKDREHYLQVGGVLFSAEEPNRLLWRSETPLWKQKIAEDKELKSVGAVGFNEKIFLYWRLAEGGLFYSVSLPNYFKKERELAEGPIELRKFEKNPIITPQGRNKWESAATFNPAAYYDGEKVNILYRAVGESGLSVFGYASARDGYHIDERLDEPVYFPREEFEGVHGKPRNVKDFFKSGWGWGGCEDPKLTEIEGRIYMTYVAFNGYSEPRIALSSIPKEDFLNRKWDWEMPKLISAPGIVSKSGCIFPEKIAGKYAIFYRVFPNIVIDYRDDLEFKDGKWLEAKEKITIRYPLWDSRKVGVGAPPIKTELGWLVIYYAVDDRDPHRYKIGAMILDLDHPAQVLFRTNRPILTPAHSYEYDGTRGIVYPDGAVVRHGTLFVYYGSADKFVCVATAPFQEFLHQLSQEKEVDFSLKRYSLQN